MLQNPQNSSILGSHVTYYLPQKVEITILFEWRHKAICIQVFVLSTFTHSVLSHLHSFRVSVSPSSFWNWYTVVRKKNGENENWTQCASQALMGPTQSCDLILCLSKTFAIFTIVQDVLDHYYQNQSKKEIKSLQFFPLK